MYAYIYIYYISRLGHALVVPGENSKSCIPDKVSHRIIVRLSFVRAHLFVFSILAFSVETSWKVQSPKLT